MKTEAVSGADYVKSHFEIRKMCYSSLSKLILYKFMLFILIFIFAIIKSPVYE